MKKSLLLAATVLLISSLSAQLVLHFDITRPHNDGFPDPCNGEIHAILENATDAATYVWSDGQTGEFAYDLCEDIFCVTVTDYCQSGTPLCTAVQCIDLRPSTPCTATSTPIGNIALTGGNPNTLYLGYGPQSTTLSTDKQGTYVWSPATGLSCTTCAAPVFTPTAAGNYTFTATVTGAGGVSTCSITICVLDIREGSDGSGPINPKKVYVCHVPPGNHANVQTISISVNAVQAHVPLHGGDHLGRCDQRCGSNKTDDAQVPELMVDEETGMNIVLYPNPFRNMFNLLLESESSANFSVKLFDINGKLVDQQNEINPTGSATMGQNLSSGIYFAHVTQGANTRIIRISKED